MDKVEDVLSASRRQESFNDLTKLSRGLQKRADSMTNYSEKGKAAPNEFDDSGSDSGPEGPSDEDPDDDDDDEDDTRRSSIGSGEVSRASRRMRRRSSRDRFANKVLGRLYESRAFTAGLVFSRAISLEMSLRWSQGCWQRRTQLWTITAHTMDLVGRAHNMDLVGRAAAKMVW
jgi:hypothetical protein